MNRLIPWKRNELQNGSTQVAPVSQVRLDWDRLFDRVLDDSWHPTNSTRGILLDLSETDEQIRLRAEVPGMSPDDLDISLSGDKLTLSGQKVDEDKSQEKGRYYSERRFGAYKRAVKLPCAVDPENVVAEHHNGVVTVTLQKAEAVRPKRIEIKSV